MVELVFPSYSQISLVFSDANRAAWVRFHTARGSGRAGGRADGWTGGRASSAGSRQPPSAPSQPPTRQPHLAAAIGTNRSNQSNAPPRRHRAPDSDVPATSHPNSASKRCSIASVWLNVKLTLSSNYWWFPIHGVSFFSGFIENVLPRWRDWETLINPSINSSNKALDLFATCNYFERKKMWFLRALIDRVANNET